MYAQYPLCNCGMQRTDSSMCVIWVGPSSKGRFLDKW